MSANNTFNIREFADLSKEWNGDKPGINFYLFIGSLILFLVWMAFISFFFSRVLGPIVGAIISWILKRWGVRNAQFHVGSISISVLSGTIMFRKMLLVTDDFSFKINDGMVIFYYWKPVPKRNIPLTQVKNKSRLKISLNGVKIHIYNRLELYETIAKSSGQSAAFTSLLKATTGQIEETFNTLQPVVRKPPSEKADEWWDDFWRLAGLIHFEISSGWFIAGNHLIPHSFVASFENFKSKLFLTTSLHPEDRFTFKVESEIENIKVSLVKTTNFVGESEDPPRTMGDGFAILQSAYMKVFYNQEILGIVQDEFQSTLQNVPVWETTIRFDKNTVISYGPWADKQRVRLWSFFFPSDFQTTPVTVMPRHGERRILLRHTIRMSLLKEAGLDIWFLRNEELESLQTRMSQGTSFECKIPWIITENGFVSKICGTLLKAESTTSLPLREFINCETLHFEIESHFPRVYNAQQKYNLTMKFYKTSIWFIWEHKRFITDMIDEWTSDSSSDLCGFVPYIWKFNIQMVEGFEMIMVLNDKNWIDTSSSLSGDNFLAAAVGKNFYIDFDLPFDDFAPKTIPLKFNFKLTDKLALRFKAPIQSAIDPMLRTLYQNTYGGLLFEPSDVFVSVADKENHWIEIWRTEFVDVKCDFEYHPLPANLTSNTPPTLRNYNHTNADHPSKLTPDKLSLFITVGESKAVISGIVVKVFLDLKDNYFGSYDQISDIAKINENFNVPKPKVRRTPEYYRPMDVTFRLEVKSIRANCAMNSPCLSVDHPDYCPLLIAEFIAVEMVKSHTEARVQVLFGPILIQFPKSTSYLNAKDGWISLSSFQFRGHGLYSDSDVPWEIEILEYAWLVELILGDLTASIHPVHLISLIEIIDSFLLLALCPDDAMELPERFNICQHFDNINECNKSFAEVRNSKNPAQRCESSEILKYKLVRVSIDNIQLFICEEKHGMLLELELFRLSFCNSHMESMCENLKLKIPGISCKQLVLDKDTWLEGGLIKLGETNFEIRFPYLEDELHVFDERKKFLYKHDTQHHRLGFLWPTKTNQALTCGCYGNCAFYASDDSNGKAFYSENLTHYAIIQINKENEQPGFLQSILIPNQNGLVRFEEINRVGSPMETPSDPERMFTARRESADSYHSANSQASMQSHLYQSYSPYLNHYAYAEETVIFDEDGTNQTLKHFQFKLVKTYDGIMGLKLTKREESQVNTALNIITPTTIKRFADSPQVVNSFSIDNVWGKDHMSLYSKTSIEDNIYVFLTPIAVEVVDKLLDETRTCVGSIHPSYFVQNLYGKCALDHHKQPLTSSLFLKKKNMWENIKVFLDVSIPEINWILFHSHGSLDNTLTETNPNTNYITTMFISTLHNFNFAIHPSFATREENKSVYNLDYNNIQAQILQLVDEDTFDKVYHKIPIYSSTNWADIQLASQLKEKKLKVVFDFYLPRINAKLLMSHVPREKLPPNYVDTLEITIPPAHLISIMGLTLSSELRGNEQSLYEILVPSINDWLRRVHSCAISIIETARTFDEWKDLSFIKLIDEALNWHDNEVVMPEKFGPMLKAKKHSRNLNTCASCKLMLTLLRYISEDANYYQLNYWSDTQKSSSELLDQKTRKEALVALLSHWQTVLCTQIQLVDIITASKYRYMQTIVKTTDKQKPDKADGKTQKEDKKVSKQDDVEAGIKQKINHDKTSDKIQASQEKNITLVDETKTEQDKYQRTHRPKPSLTEFKVEHSKRAGQASITGSIQPSSNASFQRGHRRGPSTATKDLSMAEEQPLDLYHTILKAHKEYKEKGRKTPPVVSVSKDVNPMELLLSVFFWGFYEDRRLHFTRLDALPKSKLSLGFSIKFDEIKFDIVEKKFLLSSRNEMLVTLMRHQFFNMETFEIQGSLKYDVQMDNYNLKPSRTDLSLNYFPKIQNIRAMVALASVYFINDIALLVKSATCGLNSSKKHKSKKSLISRSVSKTSSNIEEFDWGKDVWNKLYDFQRSKTRVDQIRQDAFCIKILGNCNLKAIILESMLTELVVSVTLLKLDLDHNHVRDDLANQAMEIAVTAATIGKETGDKEEPFSSPNKPSTSSFSETLSRKSPSPEKKTNDGSLIDSMIFSMKRASLIVSEHAETDRNIKTKQILNASLRETKIIFERKRDKDMLDKIKNYLSVILGEIDADLPMHAQSIHEVVLRHGPQLNEQFHRISQYQPHSSFSREGYHVVDVIPSESAQDLRSLTSLTEVPASPTRTRFTSINKNTQRIVKTTEPTEIEINFDLHIKSIELNAQLLPSLKGKYRLDKAMASGKTGRLSEFIAEMSQHQMNFFVVKANATGALPLDTFILPLPFVKASGKYKISERASISSMEHFYDVGIDEQAANYYDIIIRVGQIKHTFSTDLLNQVLFAEHTFRSELAFLLERLSAERPTTTDITFAVSAPTLFFNLHLIGEGEPWLQLTATTPTSIAIRFTIDSPTASLTNRYVLSSQNEESEVFVTASRVSAANEPNPNKNPHERLFGKGKLQLNVKLGQLYKSALYEETQEELQELATFMAQLSVQNEESFHTSLHNYMVSVNRPILLVKSSAIDKAILLWLNYKNTYNYWREERNKLLHKNPQLKPPEEPKRSPVSRSVTAMEAANVATDMNVNLSLSIPNGLYICMPLYSSDLSDNLAALVVSLQSSDVSVQIKKELVCNADFNSFKISFIENFDEHSLSEPWLEEDSAESLHSNFFFFPHGSYKFWSSASHPSEANKNAKWMLSAKALMKGMTIEFDHRIGKLTSLLIHTLSSFTTSEDFGEEYAHSEISGPIATSRSDVVSEISKRSKPSDLQRISSLEPEDELEKVVGHENRVRWLERKMHEQSLLVTDFISCHASEPMIEKERQKLRLLELMRFKEFRHSVLEKFRKKADSLTEPESLRIKRKLITGKPFQQVEEKTEFDEKSSIATGSYSTSCMEDSVSEPMLHVSKSEPIKMEDNLKSMDTLKVHYGQKQPLQAEAVDMNIDVQITVESGQCILRTQTFLPQGMAKNQSARDLKNKSYSINPPQSTTIFAIPSVGVNAFYTSEDPSNTSPRPIQVAFPEDLEKSKKNGCLYIALELASMPDETLVTPHLADFVEQVIEPLPENLFEPNTRAQSEANTEINTVPIVTMDTSALPIDILFHATIQSSTLRFEGQQQWSSAADCLLTLPRVILYASTRKSIAEENIQSGIYLSAALSDFSLTIYSPHQQATAQNALLLTLDQLAVNAIRSKNPQYEEENKVQLVINANVGVANFNCDMRRFSELLSFPKPWYRQKLIRRIFIGEPVVTMRRPSTSLSSNQTPSTFRQLTSTPKKVDKKAQKGQTAVDTHAYEIEWAAAVICNMKWKELNVRAQMSNTMGNTTWLLRDGVLRGHLHLNSKRDRDVALSFELDSSEVNAQGGAISGEIVIAKLHVSAQHKKLEKKPPENVATARLDKVENRVEWMSRPIFIGRVEGPSLRISDEWRYHKDVKGEVTEVLCFININGSWGDLQTIITTVTSDDMKKIVKKLIVFFKEQIKNSKVVWGKEIDEASEATDESSVDERLSISTIDSIYTKRRWHAVLDLLTDIQMRKSIIPLPTGRKGVTIAGGTIEFEAGRISLACMNGEMNASSWALFHLQKVSLIFTCAAKYAFLDEEAGKIGVNLEEKFILKLDPTILNQQDSEIKADVCRVQHNRNFVLRYNATIDMCLESLIGDVLKQLNLHPESPTAPRFTHKVLELFQFPAMEAVLTTVQNLESELDPENPEVVHSSFVSEFHNAVAVQTDFNAQIGFLPELLKSYMKSHLDRKEPTSPKEKPSTSKLDEKDLAKDPRKYECERWIVDPKIRFIERFRWNPPVIDEILKKLQIFDHRTTIPKVMQRGVLDRCDTLIAEVLVQIFKQVLRE